MANENLTKNISWGDPEEHNMHTEERQPLISVFWHTEI